MKKYVIQVEGMMCGMCEKHVNSAVQRVAQVNSVESSHASGTTTIICENELDIASVKAAIEEADYKVLSVTEE